MLSLVIGHVGSAIIWRFFFFFFSFCGCCFVDGGTRIVADMTLLSSFVELAKEESMGKLLSLR
jgi:hypothetical protein